MSVSYVFFTGSACALLLLAAAKLVISYHQQSAGRWLILLLTGALCYLAWPLLGLQNPLARLLVDLPTILVPAAFWMFTHRLCSEGEDFPRWGWALVIPSIVVSVAANHIDFSSVPIVHETLYVLAQPFKLALLVAGMVELLRRYQSDLVEARRRLRAALLIAVGSYMLVVVCAEFLFSYQPVPAGVPTMHAVLTSLLTLAACLWLLALSPNALSESLPTTTPKPIEPTAEIAPQEPLDAGQHQLLEKLQLHMSSGGYRHTGLTIRELAEQLNAREHILRVLINRHLGYRNFNEYLNQFRIDEASRRLADPDEAHLPVLTIALDIGYRSLSPFNAAFKRHHECTPTEYRKAQLPT